MFYTWSHIQFECQNEFSLELSCSLPLIRLTYNCLLFMILCLYFIKWIPLLLSAIYIPMTTTTTTAKAKAIATTTFKSHNSVLFAGESIHSHSICLWPTFTYRPPCRGINTHTHSDVTSPCFSTYIHTHINTHAWMLLFFVCFVFRFSLSLSCFGLSVCVCVLYINTISEPLAYTGPYSEPYTTKLWKDLKRFAVTILRMK